MIKFTAEDAAVFKNKRYRFKGMGSLFAEINSILSRYLTEYAFAFEYQNQQNITEKEFQLVREPVQLFVKVKNCFGKDDAEDFRKNEFDLYSIPVYEYIISDSGRSYSENYLVASEIITINEVKQLTRIASKANAILKSFFERRKAILTELYIKFVIEENRIIVSQEFTPLTLRINSQDINDLQEFVYNNSANLKKYSNFILEVINKA